jgi:hypothetical protein
MQGTGVHDPGTIEIGGLQQEAFVTAAKDGAFPTIIYEDQGVRAGGVRNGYEARINASAVKCAAVQSGGLVVAQLSDVSGAEAPCLAGDNGRRGLTAGHGVGVFVLRLGSAFREVGDGNQRVGGVQPHAYKVNL